jgi:predicted Zn-dependent peptidase
MKVARVLLLACALLPAHSFAQTQTQSQHVPQIKLDVRRVKLDNGLRVVLSPDHTTPTIAVDVIYDVGGRNEERGHSGFAHLFEHMMFQGSANVARGEHFKLVTSHGGTLNGTTSEDRTNYFEMLPRSELPLAVWLEGDRMRSLDISQFNFENQRKVVEEEYRMRVSNAPYVPAEIRLDSMVNAGYWPYEHPAIGNMQDLEAAQLEWVRAFHDQYYAPNNAVLSVSGDFDPDECMSIIRKYFGPIKPQPNVPPYQPGPFPQQKAARDAIVEDSHAQLPAIMMGWPIPAMREKDHYALELLAVLLADGDSSRLESKLVRERAIATEVDAGTEDRRGPDSFMVTLKVASSATPAQVQSAFDAELARIKAAPPTDEEMKKLRNLMESHFLFGLQSNYSRAQKLAEFELYWGDANLLLGELDKYLAVKKEDISRVASQYLKSDTRSRIEVKPASEHAPKEKEH